MTKFDLIWMNPGRRLGIASNIFRQFHHFGTLLLERNAMDRSKVGWNSAIDRRHDDLWECCRCRKYFSRNDWNTALDSTVHWGESRIERSPSSSFLVYLLTSANRQYLTASELHAVMTSGFATVSGTVLAAYISFGAEASHLIISTVMAAPASLAFSKLFLPEEEDSQTTSDNIAVPKSWANLNQSYR